MAGEGEDVRTSVTFKHSIRKRMTLDCSEEGEREGETIEETDTG